MIKLGDIPELSSQATELLEAVGYLTAEDLSKAESKQLHSELKKANEMLHLSKRLPAERTLKKWIGIASSLANSSEENTPIKNKSGVATVVAKGIKRSPEKKNKAKTDFNKKGDKKAEIVNFEEDQAVQKMLKTSPEAQQLSAAALKRSGVEIEDIPEATLLTECPKEININVLTTDRVLEEERNKIKKNKPLNFSNIRTLEEARLNLKEKKAALQTKKGKHKNHAKKKPELEKTDRTLRGVPFPLPWEFWLGAFFSVLAHIALFASLIGLVLLFFRVEIYGKDTTPYMLTLLIATGVIMLLYVFFSVKVRCRVCNQRQFVPKKCNKNVKAHRFPLVGNILPTALHSLIFGWCYCIYCGTAIRFRK